MHIVRTKSHRPPKKLSKKGRWIHVGYGQDGGSLWSWISDAASTVYNKAIKPAANYVVNNPSKVLSLIPHPYAQGAAKALQVVGKGKSKAGKGAASGSKVLAAITQSQPRQTRNSMYGGSKIHV